MVRMYVSFMNEVRFFGVINLYKCAGISVQSMVLLILLSVRGNTQCSEFVFN